MVVYKDTTSWRQFKILTSKLQEMENIWIITVAIVSFSILNFLFYKSLYGYVKKEVGERRWKIGIGGNKFYFWQSSIFFSTAGTALIMFTLKWTSVLNF